MAKPRPPHEESPLNEIDRPSPVRRAQRLAARLPARWDRRLRELGKVAINYRGARSTAVRRLMFPLLGRWFRLLVTPYGEGMMMVDSTDVEISRAVFINGEYERRYMQAAVECLRERGGELGPVFVDVGANIGISTVDALLHFGFTRAVCFEPDSRNFRLLRANLTLNDLDARADAHRVALSDSDGEGEIARSEANFGDSQLVTESNGNDRPDRERVVKRRLDALVEEGVIDPKLVGLLWVDVQGHDPLVLAGARSLLAAGVPVVVEYWPQGLAAAGGLDLFESLVTAGYSSVVDLRRRCDGAADRGVLEAADVGRLRSRYQGGEFTDLLLLA